MYLFSATFIFFVYYFSYNVFGAKTIRYDNFIYEPQVRSVQLYKGDNQLTYPILELNKEGILTLEFDELTKDASNLTASVVLCDADWTPSSYFVTDWFEGFVTEPINNIMPSQNTLNSYIHYRYQFPSSGKFKKSGNYLLKIYRNNDEEELLLTRRFIIFEDLVKISGDAGFTPNTSQRFKLQSVNFFLHNGAVNIMDPFAGIGVSVMQNFRWETMRSGLKPAYVYTDKIEYRFDSQNDFDGGNEFRFFDLRNLMSPTGRMRVLTQTDTGMFVQLSEDRPRTSVTYSSEPDFNGNYFIGMRQFPDVNHFADYAHVRFILNINEPFGDGDVYLFGAMTDWQLKPQFKMRYLPDQKVYERTVLLKQGIYNYQYVVGKAGSAKLPDEERLEGNHFETENNYTIFIYYKAPSDRAARIVGLRHLNYYD